MADIDHGSFSIVSGSCALNPFGAPAPADPGGGGGDPTPTEPSDPDPAALHQGLGYTRLGGRPGAWVAPIDPRWAMAAVAKGAIAGHKVVAPPPVLAIAGYSAGGRLSIPPTVIVPSTEPGPYWNDSPYSIGTDYTPGRVVQIRRSGFSDSVSGDCYTFQVTEACPTARFTVSRDDGQPWDAWGYFKLLVLAYGTSYEQWSHSIQTGTTGPVSRSHSLYTGYSPGYCISFESDSSTPFNYTLTIEF